MGHVSLRLQMLCSLSQAKSARSLAVVLVRSRKPLCCCSRMAVLFLAIQ